MTKSVFPILVVMAALLGGCATPVSQVERAKIKTVAVVSDLAPEVIFRSMGILPVIQHQHSSRTEAFSVSGTAETVVAKTLASEGYIVKPVSNEFRQMAKRLIRDRFRSDELASLKPYAKDFDAVVFIVSQKNQGLYGGDTGFGGVEVIPSKIFGMKSMMINCNTGLFVYSTATGRRIGSNVEAKAFRGVRGVKWKERWKELSPADQAKIISDLKATIQAALKPKIEKLL